MRKVFIGKNVNVQLHGVTYPAKVTGYGADHNGRLEEVFVQICEGFRVAAGAEHFCVKREDVSARHTTARQVRREAGLSEKRE